MPLRGSIRTRLRPTFVYAKLGGQRDFITKMRLFLLTVFAFLPTLLAATPPIQFEPNQGQTDARVRYLARSPQGIVFFTDHQVVFSHGQEDPLTFELTGGNAAAKWRPFDPTGDETSYHVGRDPRRLVER